VRHHVQPPVGERGVARTVLLMWRLRWAYFRGADPAELARRYR
jgi:hypothetical protein